MKSYRLIALTVAMVGTLAVPCAHAQDTMLLWDRSTDVVTGYYVYYCTPTPCTIATNLSGGTHKFMVPQVVSGQTPTFYLPLDIIGNIAVTAYNSAGESPLSVVLPFNSVPAPVGTAPVPPTGLAIH